MLCLSLSSDSLSLSGLPDGLFSIKNPKLGIFWRTFYGKCWYILWPFGICMNNVSWTLGLFCVNLVHFSPFWYIAPRKIWQPCSLARFSLQSENKLFRKKKKLCLLPKTLKGHLRWSSVCLFSRKKIAFSFFSSL
jgi:hypothetical protein